MSREMVGCEREKNFWPLDLHTAASLGNVMHFVKYDTGKLKSIIQLANSSGWTPLMYACGRGHSSLVNYLLVSGARRECKTKSGVTPLMLAITSGDVSTVESVFDPANMEDRDYRQWTPIFYAVHFTREMCLTFLLEKGANVNVVDYQNETPLMMAIKIGRETMIRLILKSATNLNVVSFKQESALSLANESACPKIKSLIEERFQHLKKIKLDQREPETSSKINNEQCQGTSPQHSSSTSLTHQLKAHLRMGKSLSYSPGKALKCESQFSKVSLSPWKIFPKKFWSPQPKPQSEVKTFLEKLGLDKYWPIFRDEEVDFETLLTLNDDNLIELGIRLFGPRKKIVQAIQKLRMQSNKERSRYDLS